MLHLNVDLTEIAVCVRGAFVRARHGACECVLHCTCTIYGTTIKTEIHSSLINCK